MALVIVFGNISDLADVSDYEVTVAVGGHNFLVLHKSEIKGHARADGWQALVKQFAASLKEEKHGT